MNDGTSRYVTIAPLSNPSTTPTARHTAMPCNADPVCTIAVAPSTLINADALPIDRSSCPAMITNVAAKDTIARIDAWVSTFVMFMVLRNASLVAPR